MENTTIKSTFLLINSTMHKPIHNRIRHTNLNMAYPFIASYFLQRYSKSSAEQSNLFEIVMPRCSVSYVKMQIECRTIKLV